MDRLGASLITAAMAVGAFDFSGVCRVFYPVLRQAVKVKLLGNSTYIPAYGSILFGYFA